MLNWELGNKLARTPDELTFDELQHSMGEAESYPTRIPGTITATIDTARRDSDASDDSLED